MINKNVESGAITARNEVFSKVRYQNPALTAIRDEIKNYKNGIAQETIYPGQGIYRDNDEISLAYGNRCDGIAMNYAISGDLVYYQDSGEIAYSFAQQGNYYWLDTNSGLIPICNYDNPDYTMLQYIGYSPQDGSLIINLGAKIVL